MDFMLQSPDENIREIEDIIDIQKANGNFNSRQVAFDLPHEEGGSRAAGLLARSFESGLTRAARARSRGKKRRRKGRESPASDNVSWPSDSDITVLRMKTCGRDITGDGLHRPDDGCSMVNLATLVQASKQSLAQDLLLPLSSWEQPAAPAPAPLGPDLSVPETSAKSRLAKFMRLYFCPCCTCLYEMERNIRDEPSVYLTSTRRSLGAASEY